MRTGVALGSNLGDRLANLKAARRAIVDLASPGLPVVSSPIYETQPIDCEQGAGQFLNAVVEFGYEGEPIDLLGKLIRIEESLGRRRNHARNISRTIDLDLLYFGDRRFDSERLQLPHPRLHLRRFVLRPLADIRPDLILPGQRKSVRELLARLDDSSKVVRCKDQWEPII
jgi:2-amino-4-hydroxy-6-hydroxymethyldihydropteridine diphosphokinase